MDRLELIKNKTKAIRQLKDLEFRRVDLWKRSHEYRVWLRLNAYEDSRSGAKHSAWSKWGCVEGGPS